MAGVAIVRRNALEQCPARRAARHRDTLTPILALAPAHRQDPHTMPESGDDVPLQVEEATP